MKIIREARNILDGKYTIREDRKKRETETPAPSGFVGGESRVVRRLLELGLALPQGEKRERA